MPQKFTEQHKLFLHELGDALTFERTLVKLLPKFQQQATNKELAKGFKKHLQESRKHVTNVEKAFKAAGRKPKAERCPGIEGLKAEHDQFVKTKPTPEVLDVFLTGAAARVEHYEIATYEGLITWAKSFGWTDAVTFLEENLKQDKQALKDVQTFAKRFASEFGKWQNGTAAKNGTTGRGTGTRKAGTRASGTTTTRAGTTPTPRRKTRKKTTRPTAARGGTTTNRQKTTRASGSTGRRTTSGTSRTTTSARKRTSGTRQRTRA